MNSGVVYIAAGRTYLQEAGESAASLKQHMPETQITIYTDKRVERDIFDDVRSLPNPQYTVADSIPSPDMLPYDRTILLDTDTYICADISTLFELLADTDLAVCHAPGRKQVSGTPDCIREYNTGVVALRDEQPVREFLREWNDAYDKQITGTGHVTNQETFTRTLYYSGLDYKVLPREYNVKLPSGYVNGRARVVHGNHPSGLKSIAESLNRTEDPRVFAEKQTIVGEPLRVLPARSRLSKIQFYPHRLRGRLVALANKYLDGGVSGAADAVQRFVRRRLN
jgi:hypothetical protein